MERVEEKDGKREERRWEENKRKGEVAMCKKENVSPGGWWKLFSLLFPEGHFMTGRHKKVELKDQGQFFIQNYTPWF